MGGLRGFVRAQPFFFLFFFFEAWEIASLPH